MLTREQFLTYLRDTLNHLYYPEKLRQSPLAAIFGVNNRFDTASALQRLLIEAIRSLKPSAGEAPRSKAWQVYEPLFYRYVEQLDIEQVADQLGVGTRHLRRWQHNALEALSERLWMQFGLDENGKIATSSAGINTSDDPSGDSLELPELSWLKEASQISSTDPTQALPPLVEMAERLAQRHGARLSIMLPANLPTLAVPSVALRQIVIGLFSVVIPRATDSTVNISGKTLRWDFEINVTCSSYKSGLKPILDDEAAKLRVSQKLAGMCHCQLTLQVDARTFDARLSIPALEQMPILAVDDSADTLNLLQRYTLGSRYRLVSTRDADQIIDLVKKIAPQVIVLDVMMPNVDGWEILGRLPQHPVTANIPIVICSVLPQEEMALMLGASAFLRKPLSRNDFLAALDDLLVPREPAPR